MSRKSDWHRAQQPEAMDELPERLCPPVKSGTWARYARYAGMTMMLIVVFVVSGALVAGALWGAYGSMGKQTEGFLVALAGGALLLSV